METVNLKLLIIGDSGTGKSRYERVSRQRLL